MVVAAAAAVAAAAGGRGLAEEARWRGEGVQMEPWAAGAGRREEQMGE